MSQPWEKDFKAYANGSRVSLRFRARRKVKTGLYALGLVMFCYMALAKHTFNSGKTVK